MQQRGPWKRVSTRIVYDNPWISVVHDEVITPKGTQGIYGTVHFKNLAIGVIPIDAEGNTWLVGQHRYPQDQYSWEIPEGGGLLGIDPLESAARELKEEVGLTARRWDLLMEMDLSNSVSDERAYVYLARELTLGASSPEATEELVIRRLPFSRVYQGVLDGEYRDSLTVAGVLRLGQLVDCGKIRLSE